MPSGIPLPVSPLLRRARNAKSPKDRHDTAWFAWEASVVLLVAARPPADLQSLQRPSVGSWVGAARAREGRFDDARLLAAFGLLAEVGTDRKARPKSVTAGAAPRPLGRERPRGGPARDPRPGGRAPPTGVPALGGRMARPPPLGTRRGIRGPRAGAPPRGDRPPAQVARLRERGDAPGEGPGAGLPRGRVGRARPLPRRAAGRPGGAGRGPGPPGRVPDPGQARRGGDGRRPPGAPGEPRADGGLEGAPPGDGRRPGGARAVRPGGGGALALRAQERRQDPRLRGGQGHPLLRDGADRGDGPLEGGEGEGGRAGVGAGVSRRGAGARPPARGGDRAPGREAREPDDHGRRPAGRGDGPRPRVGDGGEPVDHEGQGAGAGDAPVHGARAAPAEPAVGGPPRGRLRARGHVLRDGRGPPAPRRRHRGAADRADPPRDAAPGAEGEPEGPPRPLDDPAEGDGEGPAPSVRDGGGPRRRPGRVPRRAADSARPPTLRYVLGLAIRRNKPLAATVAVAALLLAGVITWAFLTVTAERDQKAAALGTAERERNEKSSALDAKARALDEVLRLADSKRARDLVLEEETLWPVAPERAPAMADWLPRVEALSRNRSDHEAALARVRESALPYDDAARERDQGPIRARIEEARSRLKEARGGEDARAVERIKEEIRALEEEARGRRTWSFADPEADWRHQTLEGLLADIVRLAGLGDKVKARHAEASTLGKQSVEDHADAWRASIEGIAASPRYGGLRITPQVGLVPLGPDPDSGLFEFAHLGSGSLPSRDPSTGRLGYAEDAAIVLVLIPGGTFRMGAQRQDPDAPNYDPQAEPDESPVHEVALTPYLLAKHECTQAQWFAMTGGARPSDYAKGQRWSDRTVTDRNPVEQVSWEDATTWLTRRGLGLPTEAQWEHACRAGTDAPWWTGREVARLGEGGNVCDRYLKEHGGRPEWPYSDEVDDGQGVHAPVGTYRANGFGLHDTAGNVNEWCRDAHARYAPGATKDPLVDGPGARVPRGGSWVDPARVARSAVRSRSDPGLRGTNLGVRPARPVTPP